MSGESTVPSASPFTFTLDFHKVCALLAVGLLAVNIYFTSTFRLPVPVPAAPSVPSLIPPPLAAPYSQPALNPFVVVCPFCNNRITIRPSAPTGTTHTGDMPAVKSVETRTKTAN